MVARNVAWVASSVVVAALAGLTTHGATCTRIFVIIVRRCLTMGRGHCNKCDSKLFGSYTPMPGSWNEPPMPVVVCALLRVQ